MAINPGKLMLKQGKTALLICDIQAKFSKVTYRFDNMITNTKKLINGCKLLNVPMIVTEQSPNSLGPTVSEFDLSNAKGPFAKTQFSMCIPEVTEALSKICSGSRPEALILAGLEAHVCIENTAIDLKESGYQVHVVADCVSSRTQEDRLFALERLKAMGCVIATSENVIFKLTADAKHDQFKNILEVVRGPMAPMGLETASKL